jgi:hypothetical protein
MYQRQITKKALSKTVMDGTTEENPTFSTAELQALFK